MAVKMTTEDGLILDHDEAIKNVYRMCIDLSSFSSSCSFNATIDPHSMPTATASLFCHSKCFISKRDESSHCDAPVLGQFDTAESTKTCEPSLCVDTDTLSTESFSLNSSGPNSQIKDKNCDFSENGNQLKDIRSQDGGSGVKRNINHNDSKELTILNRSSLVRTCLKLRQGFFAINIPYMMDTQFEKVNKHLSRDQKDCESTNVAEIQHILSLSRKRKRMTEKFMSNEEERLCKVHSSLMHEAREKGIFQKHIPVPFDNNQLSRQCAQLDYSADAFDTVLLQGDGLPLFHTGDVANCLEISTDCSAQYSATELIHRRVRNKESAPAIISVDETHYVLPVCSDFLLSNFEDFCDHLYSELADGFDLIVLDPPWENKSVKRKKSYDMIMCEDRLQELPMTKLMRPGCLVAQWVTNNDRLENFSKECLFPAWGLSDVRKWHWLKVTRTGDFISNMGSGHKKTYEALLLGKFVSNEASNTSSKQHDIPENKVIMSVPCSLHSKKPPLAEVLSPYLPDNPRCLELFARNLWPGWTSWGREALKHQNLLFYEEVQPRS